MPIRLLSPSEALARQRAGALLVDVRGDGERALGMAAGAIGIDREQLQADPARHLADPAAEILLICQLGLRSQLAAQALAACGYRNLASVEGGLQAWQAAGLPMAEPTVDADFGERYARHLRLPGVGVDGQAKLEVARVLLVGAGGLGSPAAFYLAAAGVGHLRIADDDVVDRSNLQRQILHTEARIGLLGKPLVYGAVHRFEGQASVFDAGRHRGSAPCYRCLFPEPPPPEAAPNCAEAGVLGVLPGVIGLLQATEAIKLLLGIGDTLRGRLLQFDALAMRFRETAGRRPAVSGLRAGSRIQWICGLRGVLRRELR